MKRVRAVIGLLVGGVFTAGLVALSGFPLRPAGDDAVLRLSWRARSPRVQQCRTLSPEEIASQPGHMRRTEECEGRVLPYLLDVSLDGRRLMRRTVRGGGAREDRPVYVFSEISVPPGRRRLDVRFTREALPEANPGRAGGTPARLTFGEVVELKPDEVLLITLDEARGALVARSAAPSKE